MLHVRKVLVETSKEKFPQRPDFDKDEFAQRLKNYEAVTQDLRRALAGEAYWGGSDHIPVLTKATRALQIRSS